MFCLSKSIILSIALPLILISANLYADNSGHNNMSGHKKVSMKNMPVEVVTTGVIQSVLVATKQLKIKHQMIPEWKMQAMQMKFSLAPSLDISQFSKDQIIKFKMRHENMMKFTVLEIL